MDLPENWEKIALIIVGVIFLATIIYALNPFQGKPTNLTQTQTPPNYYFGPIPFNKINISSNSPTNTSAPAGNGSYKLTADQAKTIALQQNPDYGPLQPFQGSISINGTFVPVWIVPLSQNNVVSKTIYIDANTGNIVLAT